MLTTCTVVDLTQCWQECKVTKVYNLAAELEIDTNVKIHIYIYNYLLVDPATKYTSVQRF